MASKTMKRFLAEQAQKAEAIEQINKSFLRVEEAQEDAKRQKQQHDQYMEALKASQELVNEMQHLVAASVLSTARRGLEGQSVSPLEMPTLLPSPESEAAKNGNGTFHN